MPPLEFTVRLPDWVGDVLAGAPADLAGDGPRMRLAVELARRSVVAGHGPFGAVVFPVAPGPPIAAGINLVVGSGLSLAHAEVLALALAQRARGSHDLGAGPPLELVTSAQPCVQCYGAIWWSGIRRLVVGAPADDVARIGGFAEGPLPADWCAALRDRAAPLARIEVVTGVLADDACAVLRAYRDAGGPAYNPT